MALRRRQPVSAALAAGLAVVFLATPLAGDARESYRAALTALEDRRFDDAVELLHEALAERPEERASGFGRRAYFPHYYLGVAFAEGGDCRAALDAWAESERQGQIRKDAEESPVFARRQQACQDLVAELDAARTAAEQALARARKAAAAITELRQAAELEAVWSRGEPSFADREAAARGRLAEAEAELHTATDARDVAPFQSAKAMARLAASELDALAADARERLGEQRTAAQSALERLASREGEGFEALRGIASLEPLPPELGRLAAEVESLLDRAMERKAAAVPAELERLDRDLRTAIHALRQAAQGPPESLVEAVEAFLDGRYPATLAALEGEDFSAEPRAAAQACLLRSAALYNLHVLGGEDGNPAAELDAEITACGELVAAEEISTRFFSPRFIRFYGEVLAAGAPLPNDTSEP